MTFPSPAERRARTMQLLAEWDAVLAENEGRVRSSGEVAAEWHGLKAIPVCVHCGVQSGADESVCESCGVAK